MRLLSLMLASLLALSAMIVLPPAAAHSCQEGNPRNTGPCGECPDGENHEHFHQDGTLHCHSNSAPPPPPPPPKSCAQRPIEEEMVCRVNEEVGRAREVVDDLTEEPSEWVQCIMETNIGDVLETRFCVPPCNDPKWGCAIRLESPDELMLLA